MTLFWLIHSIVGLCTPQDHTVVSQSFVNREKKPKLIETTTGFIFVIKGLKATMQKEHNYSLNKTYSAIFPVQSLQLALPTIELRNHLHLKKR